MSASWRLIVPAVLLAGLTSAAVGWTAASAGPSPGPEYERTSDGRTYGRIPAERNGIRIDELPDLVPVTGEHGRPGYVEHEDIFGPVPDSPEEALKWQRNAPPTREIPVYDKDGNVIDSFVVLGPASTGVEQSRTVDDETPLR